MLGQRRINGDSCRRTAYTRAIWGSSRSGLRHLSDERRTETREELSGHLPPSQAPRFVDQPSAFRQLAILAARHAVHPPRPLTWTLELMQAARMRISRSLLNRQLAEVGKSFRKNELAYLALTGAIENPIRDHLAWSLHTLFEPEGVIIREWNRRDLVIFRRGSASHPDTIIELKSMGILSTKYRQLRDDLQKAKRAPSVNGHTKIFGILLQLHL